jgi:two-component sensor histidine kinase
LQPEKLSGDGREARGMTHARLAYSSVPPSNALENLQRRTISSYEHELAEHRCTEIRLREALAQDDTLLRQKDELIQRQQLLNRESDHRLLNDLQLIVSLLSRQSRLAANADTASQLAAAADRIATIGRVHRRLHSFDGVQTVPFRQYIEDLCRDFSPMLPSEARPHQVIVVEGIEIELPSFIAIPLGYIVNELITNAAKYGKGRIVVRLEQNPGNGHALSVSNDGPVLPEGFDPAACKGLGMRIIRSLVEQIGGELRIGRGDDNQGTRFTVLF